jgi:hypothetical protein
MRFLYKWMAIFADLAVSVGPSACVESARLQSIEPVELSNQYGHAWARSLSENSKGSRAWGLHGERKARGGGDVHAHRRRRATQRSSSNPHAPFGFRLGRGICFVGAPRRCAPTSPASRRLASTPSKPGTRPLPILGQAPSGSDYLLTDSANFNPNTALRGNWTELTPVKP